MPMKTIEGYSKEKYTNTSVLLAGGGAKALSDFIGSISWDSTNKKIKYTPVGGSATDLVTLSWDNIANKPTSLPANGGNADTVDNVHLEWSGSQAASSTEWLAGWTSNGTKIKAVKRADLSVNYASSAGSAGSAIYITPQSYTPTSDTVGGHKAGLVNWLNTDSSTGIGKNIIISESIISQWDNDSAKPYPSSVYAMIKIGGGYNYSTYGQWLLSSYNQTRLGVVGRTGSVWSSIKWIAWTSDIPTNNNQLTNGAGYITGITKKMVTDALGYTPPTTNTTYNFSGTSFTSGNSSNGEHNANNITSNGHWYYSSNGPSTSLGASTTDGALYSQAYSTSWVGQIAQDYRNGNLFTRGKNNGTWTDWKAVSYVGHTHSYLSLSGGTMSTTNVVTNLNADLLDGKHANAFATSSHTHPYLSFSSIWPTNITNLNDYFSSDKMYSIRYDYARSSNIQNGPYESDAGAVINFPTYSGTQVYFNYYNNDIKIRTYYAGNGHITNWDTFITSSNWSSYISIPSVGNGTVTVTQAGSTIGSFTMNQSGNTLIALNDTNTNYYPIRSYTSGLKISSYSGSNNCELWVPDASNTQAGVVNTGTQTFGGAKTFTGAMTVNNTITFGTSDSYGIRTASDNYGKIGESNKRFYQCYVKNSYSTNGFYEDSDERLKNIIKSVKVDLDELSKLRKIYYIWKNPKENQLLQLGMIAQDVQRLYPELVSVDKETGYLSLSYDKLSVIALEAIDTLYTEYKQLKERINELEKLLYSKEIL